MKPFLLFICCVAIASCSQQKQNLNFLEVALSSDNAKIKRVIDSIDNYQVQIKYTQIDRKNDSVIFTDYDFQVNDSMYFYPASTVKFPTAVLALEKLNKIDSLSIQTKYYVEGDTIESTFAISEIFAVSDNLANNRLVEFLGFEAINQNLREKGISPVRITHRLGQRSDDLRTKPLIIYINDSTTGITSFILNKSPDELELLEIKKGVGYYENEELVEVPFNFSQKNYYPISSQHNVLKRILFPNNFEETERFHISAEQREKVQ